MLDFDNDGWSDIYVANDSIPNYLWRNKGNGTFEEVGFEAGCALSLDGRAQSSMGIAVGDYNADGWLDLFVTNFAEDYNTLYRNRNGRFDDVTYEAGLGIVSYTQMGWGTAFYDFDNDGWQELFVANGHIYPNLDTTRNSYKQDNQLFRNIRNGRFALIGNAESGFAEKRSSRAAAFACLANDGRSAIVVNNIDDAPFLYKPRRSSCGGWVLFKLVGTKSNRDAIGARVTVKTGSRTQVDEVRSSDSYIWSSDVRLHFGLGDVSIVDEITIRWPNGQVEQRRGLQINREHVIRET